MADNTKSGGKAVPSTPVDDPAFRKVLQQSPALQAEIEDVQSKGFKILWGDPGKGTYLVENVKDPRVVIDENAMGDGARIAGALAHEIGHQKFQEPLNRSTKESYIRGLLRDEAAATINAARVRDEILDAGGPDIGFAGLNAKQYREITDELLAGKVTEKEAVDSITEVYKTERTSNTKQTYEEYYGNSYRGRSPTPELPAQEQTQDGRRITPGRIPPSGDPVVDAWIDALQDGDDAKAKAVQREFTWSPEGQRLWAEGLAEAHAWKAQQKPRLTQARETPLFNQAMDHLDRLAPQLGQSWTPEQREQLAGTIALEARRERLPEISALLPTRDGGVVAVWNSPYDRILDQRTGAIDPAQASEHPLQQSMQQFSDETQRQQQAIIDAQQRQMQEQQRGMSM